MRGRFASWSRPAWRVLLIAVLAYPLTGATTGTDDSRYADYLIGSDSGGACGSAASQESGGWVCWFPLSGSP